MADKKLSQLTALTGANTAAGDLLYIVDVSEPVAADQSKKITLTEFQAAPVSAGTANGVAFLNASKVLTTGSALTFDGTNFGVGGGGDPFGRFYGRSVGLSSASSAFIEINAATGSSSGIDFGVNTARTAGITSNTTETNFTTLGATPMLFGINGAEQMRLIANNLLLGTTTQKVTTVTGGATGLTIGGASAPTIALWDTDNAAYVGYWSQINTTMYFGNNANGSIEFGTNAATKAILTGGGNFLIGTTTDAARLTVSGNVRSLGGNFELDTGQVTTNSGSNPLILGVNGSEKARILSNGDLLVGTTTAILASANRGNITIGGSASSILALGSAQANSLYVYTDNTNTDFWNTANGFVRFGTNNAERARITAAGSFLVGQTTLAYQAPNDSVQVNGSFNTGGFGRIQTPGQQIGSATYAGLYGMANLYLAYYNGGWKSLGGGTASAVTIDEGIYSFSNSQNIGAADTALTWTTRFTISSTSTDINNGYVKIGSPATSTDEFWLQPGSTEFALRGRQAKSLTFWTSDIERGRFNSSGDWLINGSSNTLVSGYASKMTLVYPGGNAQYGFALRPDTDTTTAITFCRADGLAVVGTITQTSSATAYNTSSDYRLKNITGPVTNSGAYIDSLRPVEGTWKADGSTFVGLIAHEVQEASRTSVATGEKDGEQMQAMDYSSPEIIANLIAEIQSLRARLAAAGI